MPKAVAKPAQTAIPSPATAEPEAQSVFVDQPETSAPAPAVQADPLQERMSRLMTQAPPAASGNGPATDRELEASVLSQLGATDFGAIQSQQFRLLPIDRECEALITKAGTKRASSGNPMITLEMTVIAPEECRGVKLFDQCVLVENSMWKSKSLFEATGLLGEDGRFSGEAVTDLVDYAVRFMVKHEEYQGATRNKIAGGYSEAYEAPEVRSAAHGDPSSNVPQWGTPSA